MAIRVQIVCTVALILVCGCGLGTCSSSLSWPDYTDMTDGTGTYETLDIVDYCTRRYNSPGLKSVDHLMGVLIYSVVGTLYDYATCQLTLSAPRGFVLLAKAEKMVLGGGVSYLDLFDGSDTSTAGSTRYYEATLFQYNTTQQSLTIKLVTPNKVNNVGFRLVVTPISKGVDCPNPHFTCNNGNCIAADMKGDGHQNCPDNSDESGPSPSSCENGMVSCGESGPCIALSWKCDRFVDCPNSSDEQNCLYKCPGNSNYGTSSEYSCQDGYGCYSPYTRCNHDSWRACRDGSDDMNCDSCSGNYQYRNGFDGYCPMTRQCLSTDQICNGIIDCPNGADEDEIQCNPSIYWYWSGGQLAGLFIGFIIFVVIVVVIVAVVHKKCGKEGE